MDERRLTCSSSNKTNNHHEENRFGGRHEAHHRTSRLLLCALCISIALVLPQLTSAREHRRAEHRRAEPKKDEPAKAEGGKAEGGKAEGGKAEGGKAEGGKAEGGKAEGGKAEGGKAEGGKAEGGKLGAKHEGGKAEGGKAEGEKKEGEKKEGEKKEGEKGEGEKGEGAKTEDAGKADETASNDINGGNETLGNETLPEENGNETLTNETGITGMCPNHCWEKAATAQDVNFEDGVHRPEITNQTGCKQACTNNETCVGALWGFHANSSTITCFLQIPSEGSSGSLSNADQFTFNNCSDDCFPYCWDNKTDDVQTLGGIKTDAGSEEQCKSLCAEDPLCDGADWNPTNISCWLLYNHKRTEDPVNHWEIVRNLTKSCTKSEEQCMPRCWNKTLVNELSVKDALIIKEESDVSGCKELCGNNQTCIGVYWAGGGGGGGGGGNSTGSNGTCYFQMPFDASTVTLQNITHWRLSNCTDDCLTYCWLPKFDHIQTGGGALQDEKHEENECKLLCSSDDKCTGVDWSATDTSCSILHQSPLVIKPTSDPIHHWQIQKNLPMVCNPEEEEEKPAEAPSEPEAPATAPNNTESNNEEEEEEPAEKNEPEVGESAVTTEHPPVCPNYMIGIITMSAMAAVCLLIIICLIAFIISRTIREDERSGGYESVPG